MRETKHASAPSATTVRPRRDKVLALIPDHVPRKATALGDYLGISDTTAWRMLMRVDKHGRPADYRVGPAVIAAVAIRFPDQPLNELFEVAA